MNRPPVSSTTGLLLQVAAAGLALGSLTAYAQQWLPAGVGSLANSAGPWGLAAFLLALRACRPTVASACSALVLICLVLGYYVTDRLRGFPVSSRTVVLWGIVGIVAGPVLGLAAYRVRRGSAAQAAIAGAVPAAMLILEGCYGLTVIADTTYPPYWWGEISCGLVVLATILVTAGRRRGRAPTD
jgi:hypothetical protein